MKHYINYFFLFYYCYCYYYYIYLFSQFDLVCGQASLVEVIQAMFMAGVLVGSLVFGPFAES